MLLLLVAELNKSIGKKNNKILYNKFKLTVKSQLDFTINRTLSPLKYSVCLSLAVKYPGKFINLSAGSEILLLACDSSDNIFFTLIIFFSQDRKSR